jgi:hypothetical protein
MGHGTKKGKKRVECGRGREVEEKKRKGSVVDHTIIVKKDVEIYWFIV